MSVLVVDAVAHAGVGGYVILYLGVAFQLGVYGSPTVAIDDELFWRDDRLEAATAARLLRTSEQSRNAQDDPISRA